MRLIVGLGNPGIVYKNSRHNIGICVVGDLAKRYNIKLKSDKSALYKQARGKIRDMDFLLVYPLVFMNLPGESIAHLIKKYRIQLEDMLVVCDDLDLDLGKIRIKPCGSSAGHKGVKSIIERLNSDAFPRLRIGIGKPTANLKVKDFVLSRFKTEETNLIKESINRAVDCCQVWLTRGIKESMNQFNRKR